MNSFYYQLLLTDGRTRRGLVRLQMQQTESVRLWLERRFDAVVLRIVRLPGLLRPLYDLWDSTVHGRITDQHMGEFLRNLGVMSRSGIPMFESLQTLASEADEQPEVARLAREVLQELDAGSGVTQAFERHPDLFPETVRNLVSIGEATGEMDGVLLEAAEHVQRVARLNRDIRKALIYPFFVFASILVAALFWMYYVVPQMSDLFVRMNVELPRITLAVLATADWLSNNIAWSLMLMVGVGLLLILLLRYHQGSRWLVHRGLHHLPLSRTLIRTGGMASITEHLSLLIRAGLDIVRSLDVLARSLSDEYYRERIRAVRAIVERGERLSAAMRQVGGFPPLAVRMIAAGEETGTLDEQLRELANEYRYRFSHLIDTLAEIIKPAVILLAGGLFILLVVALFLPVYYLIGEATRVPGVGA